MVWDFDGWSVIVNIFVRTLRDARHNIGEMITVKPEKLEDRLRGVLRRTPLCDKALPAGCLHPFCSPWFGCSFADFHGRHLPMSGEMAGC